MVLCMFIFLGWKMKLILQNEQLITCAVSMIETAIAVIAACLPVLRSVFFGSKSRSGTSHSRSRAYELSFGHSRGTTTVSVARSQSQMHRLQESQDELV